MPYCVVTYDVGEERVTRVRKILKKYFTWVQNSVFEGEISEGKLEKCLRELQKAIVAESDSIYVYSFEVKMLCTKRVLGNEKEQVLNLIS